MAERLIFAFFFLVLFSLAMETSKNERGSFDLEPLPTGSSSTDGNDDFWVIVESSGAKEQSWDASNLFSSRSGRFELDEAGGKILCLFRWKVWWIIPRLVDRTEHLPPETYLVLAKLKNGKYLSILANEDFTLEGKDGEKSTSLTIHGHIRDSSKKAYKAALLSIGDDPLSLVARGVKHLKKFLRESAGPISAPVESEKGNKRRSFADLFGWCSWDSFYTDLSEEKVLDGLKSFEENTEIRPRFMILDDGWQRTDVDHKHNGGQWGGKLSSFHANFKFSDGYGGSAEVVQGGDITEEGVIETAKAWVPGDDSHDGDDFSLKKLISRVKGTYGIDQFLVWHTLTGYWGGVSVKPSSGVAHLRPELKFPHLTASANRMSVAQALQGEPFTTGGVGLVHVDHAQEFFRQYHETLVGMGVDGVKVDAQSVLPLLEDERAGGKNLALEFHRGLQSSVRGNFGRFEQDEMPVIHCMAHSQGTLLSIAALYNHQGEDEDEGERSGDVPIIRGSDDFWPTDMSSHGPHIYANGMNALLISHLGVHDWDMWQSDLGAPSAMHAASRAISGGPMYVSDKPYTQNAALLRQVSMPDGSVPRPIRGCRPTAAGLFLDPQHTAGVPLLLQNANPSGGLVVGAFNIAGSVLENDKDLFRALSPEEMTWPDGVTAQTANFEDHLGISWTVGPQDVEEWRARSAATTYVAHRFSDKALFLLGEGNKEVPVALPKVFDCEIVSFSPVLRGQGQGQGQGAGLWVAALGATDMLNPGGAVLSISTSLHSEDTGAGSWLEVTMELLGEGRYQVVVPRESRVTVTRSAVLSGDHRISGITLESRPVRAGTGAGAGAEIGADGEVAVVDLTYHGTERRQPDEEESDIRQRVLLTLRIE